MRTLASMVRRAVAFIGLSALVAPCQAQVTATRVVVVATTSDIASLAAAVGGELVRVKTIVPPMADPEAFEPRASDFSMLLDANLIIRVGLGYDFWIDKLTDRLDRPDVQLGGARSVDASIGVPLLEVGGRDTIDQDGHGHGLANPHYWLDPANAETITANIAVALIRLIPGERAIVLANRDRFISVWAVRR